MSYTDILLRMTDETQSRKKLAARYGEDFNLPSLQLTISRGEKRCIDEWLQRLKPEILKIQGDRFKDITFDEDEVYYGAIGGGVQYSFTLTSLGTILVVKESITGKELNVTDALGWYSFG